MPRFHSLLALAGIVGISQTASGQIISLVKAGQTIPGVGDVTTVDNLTINNDGDWLVEADTNAAAGDGVLLKNGVVFLREGQALPVPAGSSISSFDDITLNSASNFGGNIFLAGTGSTGNDSGVFFNATLAIQESFITTAPQHSPNTPYIGFFGARLNDNNQMFIMASVDDPAIATTVDRSIIRAQLSPTGALLSEASIAKEGDILPGHDQAVADFLTGPHSFATNNSLMPMFVVDGAGDTATDFAVYQGLTMLAREGSASPIAGRNWSSLSASRVDQNNVGGYAYTGTLAGDTATDAVIIRNGQKFIQEGDTLPAIGGVFTFTAFGTGPIDIDDNGGIAWFGDWNDPDTTRDTGLFYNDRLLVQEGVTQIDGLTVFSISSVQDGFKLSDNGRYIIFEATLANPGGNNINGAFLIEVPEPATISASAMLLLARRRRTG